MGRQVCRDLCNRPHARDESHLGLLPLLVDRIDPDPRRAIPAARRLLRIVGAISLSLAVVAAAFQVYKVELVLSHLSHWPTEHAQALYWYILAASGTLLAAYVAVGIGLLKADIRWVVPFTAVCLLDLALVRLFAALPFAPPWQASIAAAVALGSGATALQWTTKFVLWGPLLAGWAVIVIAKHESDPEPPVAGA